ncbi:hypothetical protein BHE74_00053562 [Ensete ventricosum]|nr:hypothetical protein BHE74_00053562 [Ensete ventricosum]
MTYEKDGGFAHLEVAGAEDAPNGTGLEVREVAGGGGGRGRRRGECWRRILETGLVLGRERKGHQLEGMGGRVVDGEQVAAAASGERRRKEGGRRRSKGGKEARGIDIDEATGWGAINSMRGGGAAGRREKCSITERRRGGGGMKH